MLSLLRSEEDRAPTAARVPLPELLDGGSFSTRCLCNLSLAARVAAGTSEQPGRCEEEGYEERVQRDDLGDGTRARTLHPHDQSDHGDDRLSDCHRREH